MGGGALPPNSCQWEQSQLEQGGLLHPQERAPLCPTYPNLPTAAPPLGYFPWEQHSSHLKSLQ